MKHRRQLFQAFAGFFILSLLSIVLFRSPVGAFLKGTIENIVSPVQRVIYMRIARLTVRNEIEEIKKLTEENVQLRQQLSDQKNSERDNRALRDQFADTIIASKQLLPAYIVGMMQTTFVIDKGTLDGVREGSPVVYKNIVLGRIIQISAHRSLVATTKNKKLSFTGRTNKTGVLGTVKGQGDGTLFDNVVLSEKLEKNDTIETKGDMDENGSGYPPGLLVGKITAVHKIASSLFQTAEVGELVDIKRLRMVFVVILPINK